MFLPACSAGDGGAAASYLLGEAQSSAVCRYCGRDLEMASGYTGAQASASEAAGEGSAGPSWPEVGVSGWDAPRGLGRRLHWERGGRAVPRCVPVTCAASHWGDPALQRALDGVWGHFWLSYLGCSWC